MLNNINKPAPKWYRVFNRVFPIVENTVIAVAMIYDIDANARGLLLWKIGSSFLRQALDAVLVETNTEA